MARSRKVDTDDAIAAALGVFTETGFAGIGTRELEQRTGISRFLLQTDYGGKKALYLAALDLYLDQFETWLSDTLGTGGLHALAEFFQARADTASMSERGRFGCFMLTTTAEFKATDRDINRRTQRYFEMFDRLFTDCLTQARQKAALKPDVDIDAEVALMTAGIIGINTYIRAHASNSAATPMAQAYSARIRALMM